MPSAYTQNYYHTVFSTKHRANLIVPDLEQRLYPFIGGILRNSRCTKSDRPGGFPLLEYSPKASLLKVVVGRQGFGNPVLGHHREGDAVGQ